MRLCERCGPLPRRRLILIVKWLLLVSILLRCTWLPNVKKSSNTISSDLSVQWLRYLWFLSLNNLLFFFCRYCSWSPCYLIFFFWLYCIFKIWDWSVLCIYVKCILTFVVLLGLSSSEDSQIICFLVVLGVSIFSALQKYYKYHMSAGNLSVNFALLPGNV